MITRIRPFAPRQALRLSLSRAKAWLNLYCTPSRRSDGSRPPAAWQDIAAGDGTTSVVVLCGALLKKCLELLQQGVHPTIISDGFNLAVSQAVKVRLPSTRPAQRVVPVDVGCAVAKGQYVLSVAGCSCREGTFIINSTSEYCACAKPCAGKDK